jgi:hypothetical protein
MWQSSSAHHCPISVFSPEYSANRGAKISIKVDSSKYFVTKINFYVYYLQFLLLSSSIRWQPPVPLALCRNSSYSVALRPPLCPNSCYFVALRPPLCVNPSFCVALRPSLYVNRCYFVALKDWIFRNLSHILWF